MLSIDVESTGTDPVQDRIFQIGLASERSSTRMWINPEREIPPDVVELCKLTPETLETIRRSPTFGQQIGMIEPLLNESSVWCGFNVIRFDLVAISEEFARAGRVLPWEGKSIVDMGNLYKIMRPRRLENFVQEYAGKSLPDAHDALVDAQAVLDSMTGFLDTHPELKTMSPRELAVMSNYGRGLADPAGKLAVREDGVVVFNTHRNQGVPVVDDRGYSEWLANQRWIPESTRQVIRRIWDEEDRKVEEQPKQPSLFDTQSIDDGMPF